MLSSAREEFLKGFLNRTPCVEMRHTEHYLAHLNVHFALRQRESFVMLQDDARRYMLPTSQAEIHDSN